MTLREFLTGLMRDNRSGAVSTSRSVYLGAFLVSSFSVLWVTVHCQMTEWLMIGYLGAFVTGALGSKAINATAAVKGAPVKPDDNG